MSSDKYTKVWMGPKTLSPFRLETHLCIISLMSSLLVSKHTSKCTATRWHILKLNHRSLGWLTPEHYVRKGAFLAPHWKHTAFVISVFASTKSHDTTVPSDLMQHVFLNVVYTLLFLLSSAICSTFKSMCRVRKTDQMAEPWIGSAEVSQQSKGIADMLEK